MESRQVQRKKMFDDFFQTMTGREKGTLLHPLWLRNDRRNLARARTAGAWRTRNITVTGDVEKQA